VKKLILLALVLMLAMAFMVGCDNDDVEDDLREGEHRVTTEFEGIVDDVEDGAEDIVDGIEDGAEDIVDDIEDGYHDIVDDIEGNDDDN